MIALATSCDVVSKHIEFQQRFQREGVDTLLDLIDGNRFEQEKNPDEQAEHRGLHRREPDAGRVGPADFRDRLDSEYATHAGFGEARFIEQRA